MSLELVLITGMSGSGKSVALHALEDVGFNCVDNLPPELLLPFVQLAVQQPEGRHAIAIDDCKIDRVAVRRRVRRQPPAPASP